MAESTINVTMETKWICDGCKIDGIIHYGLSMLADHNKIRDMITVDHRSKSPLCKSSPRITGTGRVKEE